MRILWWYIFLQATAALFAAEIQITIDPSRVAGPIDVTRYALGQGGLSDQPMFEGQVEQVAQLHPQTVRIFLQEFFDMYPARHRYHWDTFDKVIETVLATGAKPILCLCLKPKVLFPKIDQHIVHPASYKEWERLVQDLVEHCNRKKKFGIQYWEVSNEPDIGEDGGCPYLFGAPDYVTYYRHTAAAIRRADPGAKVGGPALAGYNSDIGTALIEHCGSTDTPLDFFSWHIYHNDPAFFRKSIRDIKAKLAKFPKLQSAETIIDEWNMSLDQPNLNPAFQPAFILETTYGFLDEGLSRSAYYHIRDSFVSETQFSKFMSPKGAAFVAHWWNETPQYDGLFDNQGHVRPAYYAFKLLSLLRGELIVTETNSSSVKVLATKQGSQVNVLVWNFSSAQKTQPQDLDLRFARTRGRYRLTRLDAAAPVNQLTLEATGNLDDKSDGMHLTLRPYEIYWVAVSL